MAMAADLHALHVAERREATSCGGRARQMRRLGTLGGGARFRDGGLATGIGAGGLATRRAGGGGPGARDGLAAGVGQAPRRRRLGDGAAAGRWDGGSGKTLGGGAYPWLIEATPSTNALSSEDIKALTKRTQEGGTEVVEAKAGKGSATLSMAYAGAVFGDACLKGLNGIPDIVECSYVQSTITELPFFASKVRLGKNGVEEVLGLGELSAFEKEGLESLKGELKSSIEKGVAFANAN